jgi:putative transposase
VRDLPAHRRPLPLRGRLTRRVRRDRQGRDHSLRQSGRRPWGATAAAERQRARAEPSRRGIVGQLVAHVSDLGTEPITGKPYKPTTQGKNERFHQTLFRYLDKQPLANTLAELQAQVDAFDDIYNTQRPHQGLPGRVTPLTAWQATAKAEAPRPKPDRPLYEPPAPVRRPRPKPPADLPADTKVRTVTTAGTIHVDKVFYKIDVHRAFEQVLVVSDGDEPGDKIIVTDPRGEILAELTRPEPGVTYVGNGRPPGTPPKSPVVSPKS